LPLFKISIMKDVTIYATNKCNIRCIHCGVGLDQDQYRYDLSTEQLKKVMYELASGGTKTITILGGEATIYRKDLAALLDFALENGLKIIINTNLLSYEAIEDLLDKPSLQAFVVSLDGASSDIHDRIRGEGTFEKTLRNIKKITENKRYKTGDILLQIAFVMNGINCQQTSKMLFLTSELKVRQLNIKNVRFVGRANLFNKLLEITSEDLLHAYTSLIINWLYFQCDIELQILITPAFAEFLNKAFGFCLPTSNYAACGGTSVFSYVDLLGNHLPCPAMSYEEKPNTGIATKDPKLNLLKNSISKTFNSNIFHDFELKRENRKYINQLIPCKYCKFNKQCQPCAANIINGEEYEEEIELCYAIYHHGDSYVKNIRENIWNNECQ